MSWRVWVAVCVIVGSAVGAVREDTARLLDHARKLRGATDVAGAQYKEFQVAYLEWLDSRIRTGTGIDKINAELSVVGLLQTSDDFSKSPAGYVAKLSVKRAPSAPSLMVVVAGMYMGAGCSLDETAILYQRNPLRRLAWINADPSFDGDAYLLSGIDAGLVEVSSARTVASGWTVSNCTSSWNGKLIRIDRVKGQNVENILRRELSAQDRTPAENVSAQVQGDRVIFRYDGQVGDAILMSGPSIGKYRVAGGQAIREAPIALTRAGFLHEWLDLNDADAAQWSYPGAAQAHHGLAAEFKDQIFDWEHVARCGGTPPEWELTIRSASGSHVFRIQGARAATLRLLSVTDKGSPSCTVIDEVAPAMPNVGKELPW